MPAVRLGLGPAEEEDLEESEEEDGDVGVVEGDVDPAGKFEPEDSVEDVGSEALAPAVALDESVVVTNAVVAPSDIAVTADDAAAPAPVTAAAGGGNVGLAL